MFQICLILIKDDMLLDFGGFWGKLAYVEARASDLLRPRQQHVACQDYTSIGNPYQYKIMGMGPRDKL